MEGRKTTSIDDWPEWEESTRQMAAQALLPVFFSDPSPHTSNESVVVVINNSSVPPSAFGTGGGSSMDPEKALKKILRLYQTSISIDPSLVSSSSSSLTTISTTATPTPTTTTTTTTTATTVEERHAVRKRLSDLILGTSVMRIRHYFTLLLLSQMTTTTTMEAKNKNPSDTPGIPTTTDRMESIVGVNMSEYSDLMNDHWQELWTTIIHPVVVCNPSNPQSNTIPGGGTPQERRLWTTRAMVDLHAEYMIRQLQDQQQEEATTAKMLFLEKLVPIHRSVVALLSIKYSLPMFLVQLLVDHYGVSQTQEIATVWNQPGPITIRYNPIQCTSEEELCDRLWKDEQIMAVPLSRKENLVVHTSSHDPFSSSSRVVATTTVPFPKGCIRLLMNDSDNGTGTGTESNKKSIWSMPAWKDGWFEVQDAGSQLIVEAADVQAGDAIVDYCAGNGGKTLALVSQLHLQQQKQQQQSSSSSGQQPENVEANRDPSASSPRRQSGCVIAHDIVQERLRQLRGSLDRVGLSRNSTNDSTRLLVTTTLKEDTGVLYQEMANVVLVDAPCSSMGVLRRRPSQRFQLTHDDITLHLPLLQTTILQEASELVKAHDGGGRLVYATCSICPSENEQVVDQFESQVEFDRKWQRWNFPEHEDNQYETEASNTEE